MVKSKPETTRRKQGRRAADKTAVEQPKREPTEREAGAMALAKAAYDTRPMRAEIEGREDDNPAAFAIGPRHTDDKGHSYQLCGALGTTSNDFTSAGLLALANMAIKDGAPSVEGVNAALALVGAIAPENELEAALALQMAATHDLSLDLLRRAKYANTREGLRDYANLATKLTRTFAVQLKALADWRRGGEQVVRHIHVQSGGQAVVAETINVGGRENENVGDRSHALGPALLGSDAQGHPVPGPVDTWTEAVPDAQRASEGDTGQ